MVVFVCTQCNATLKKSAVKNHLSFKKCTMVSCVDCHKDFDINSVESHCICISEKEKYDKARFKESSKGNKVCTQSEWIMKIEDLIENCQSTNHKRLLENLRGCHNIPKKKNKFENFMKSKYRGIPPQTIDEIWKLLESVKPVPKNTVPSLSQENVSVEEPKSKRQKVDVNGCHFQLSVQHVQHILTEFGGKAPFSDVRKKIYSTYKASVTSPEECITKKEFKANLLNFIQDSENLVYSPTDGTISITTKGDLPQTRVDSTRTSNSQSHHVKEVPVNEADQVHKSKSMKKLLNTTLQEFGGRISLKKLVKKVYVQTLGPDGQNTTYSTKDELKNEIVRKINKSKSIKLSEDGKLVELCT
ncbi:unnamed protein product [Trichobilharzia szidati]|nr:unnamed protein product [Trichobilharzia szidati]